MNDTFMDAVHKHLALVETLGHEHPETKRAMMLAMELAPESIKDEMSEKAKALGLLPEATGYLEDGSPMYRLEDIAKQLDISLEEAEETLQQIMRDKEALGLPSGVMLADDARIHKRQ